MPLYEYECPRCGPFDHLQKLSERPLKKCPTCRKPVKKKLSAPALHFKGAGWWVTDYGWKSKQKGKEGKEGESKKTEGETKKSESKGTKKSESKKGSPSGSAS